jgi:hypothetical protein
VAALAGRHIPQRGQMSASHNGGLPIILMGLVMFAGSLNVFFRRLRKIDFFLGYGQALESFLVFVKFQYFLMFAFGATLLKQDPFFIAFSAIELTDRQWFCNSLFAGVVAGICWVAFEGSARSSRKILSSYRRIIWFYDLAIRVDRKYYFRCLFSWR